MLSSKRSKVLRIRPAMNLKSQKSSAGSVSVVIPAYNAEDFLSRAIESILAQTLAPKEIIVIDDGSTDRTVEIVEGFGDKIKLISQENAGVSAARNKGIRESTGEFIAFLDSDDYFLLPTKLEEQIEIAQETSADIVISGWLVIDEKETPIIERKPWNKIPKLDLYNWLRFQGVLPSAMLFRCSALLKVAGFDEDLRHAEDIDLVLRMSLAGFRTKWLEKVVVAYRQHSGSLTRRLPEQAASIRKLWHRFFGRDDLPFHVKRVEIPIMFSTEVWIAFRAFQGGDLTLMKKQLIRSLEFTKFNKTGVLWEWIRGFIALSIVETGEKLNVNYLTESPEWRELENSVLEIRP